MSYNIEVTAYFGKQLKRLAKKFPSLKNDLKKIQINIEKELLLANNLGNGFKKIRIVITSKGKGARGGGRIITFETLVDIEEKDILFCSIYDKSDYENIDLEILKKNLDL